MDTIINYSIIIPHKNTPKLLQRCLDSIPRRKDVQIIVIDDNSDPEKVNFEEFPGINDYFIEILFTKEGKGAGYARNAGVKKAAGKWLLFADADDFFNHCINDILDEYVNSNADIVYFKHTSIDSDTYIPAHRATSHNSRIHQWFNSQKKIEPLLRYINPAVWSKLYRTELIKNNNIFFDEVSISNDVTFSFLSGFHAASVSADPRALYCTTIRKDSLRHSKRNIEKTLDIFYVQCKRYRFYKENNIPIYKELKLARFLFKFKFHSKNSFNKAKDILSNFGFSSTEIFRICVYDIIVITLIKAFGKLFKFKGNNY